MAAGLHLSKEQRKQSILPDCYGMKIPQSLTVVTAVLLLVGSNALPARAQDCLSAGCHQAEVAQPGVHSLAASGGCLACHASHTSETENRYLLKTKLPDLCLDCHADIGVASRAKVRHAPIFREHSCGLCHSVHAAKAPALLPASEKELCLSCHGQDNHLRSKPLRNIAREIEGEVRLHGPVASGECSPCHAPHGSNAPRLLRANYPTGPYAPYAQGTYALCFGCHDQAMLKTARTATDTRFRNGDRNLHYLHVADPRKGRTCTACHASHAGDETGLIRRTGSPFGDWEIPVNFNSAATGGSCAPGCHASVRYDRSRP
jgi:predicted CXXCH cytochrome family protein